MTPRIRYQASAGPVVTFALVTMVPVYFREKTSRDLEEADKMGSYELIRKLGEGGMGEVWKARHILLAHTTAIKLIKAEALLRRAGDSNAELAIRRFEREARATAALKSVNTVDLYDFGTTDDGTCYYVMELLDGMDLGALVKRFGPLPAHRAVHLLRQVCYSLIEAHERGMVHRDIKPANVFVCRMKPHHDVIKVLDFGLVKHKRIKIDETRLTSDGIVIGTPSYMAPELAVGEDEIDGRADLYSLGCVAYWLLTGVDVFEGDTPMKVIVSHVGEAPPRPSARSGIEIPRSLEDITLSCLEKNPNDRPQSARELEDRLADLELNETWNQRAAEQWWKIHLPEDEG